MLYVIGKKQINGDEKSCTLTGFDESGIEAVEIGGVSIPLTRLRELASAEREGRVVVLPCKVTDLLYVIYSPKHPANPSDKGKRFMATAQANRIKLGAKGFSIETWMGSFSESEIGKTVFFTQAEAERAIAATEPKGDATT